MKHKAIALLSGGLDSTLAVRLMLEQDIEVQAFTSVTPFCTCNRKGRCEAVRVADLFGIPIRRVSVTDEFLRILKHPRHGYGSGMNPCLDCRILTFTKAKAFLEEIGADFIFTGEVLGQRPMSQRLAAMRLVDEESGLTDRVLRPLSAQLLAPTWPERTGIVERERLLSVQGRSRRVQMDLAEQFGIADYPCPAGGCQLTDPGFARRVRDLLTYQGEFDLNDISLLKVGRHFRLVPEAKVIVGRNEQENAQIQRLARAGDILLEVDEWNGPTTLVRGAAADSVLTMAAGLTVRYSDAPGPGARVLYESLPGSAKETLYAAPLNDERATELML